MKGNGYKTIALNLNEKGFKTKLGKPFNGNGVKEILKNPTYCGYIRWGYRENWGKLHEGNKRKREYSESPIMSRGIHEAIITKETFDKVQEMIDNNTRHHMKQFNGNHLLSGLLRCPDCGYGMSIQIVKSKGKIYEYYTCNQYQTYKRCKANSIRKNAIEKEFLKIFEQAINKPEVLKSMLDGMNNISQQNKEIERTIKRKENALRNLEDKENKLLDELIEGNDNYKSIIRRKIQEVSDEREFLENDIIKLKASLKQINSSKLNTDEILQLLKNAGKLIPLLDKPAQQSLVRTLTSSINLENKRIKEVHFNFREGEKVVSEGDSSESPSDNQCFRVQNDTVHRTMLMGDFYYLTSKFVI